MLQALFAKPNSFLRPLKKKGFKEERVTTMGLYDRQIPRPWNPTRAKKEYACRDIHEHRVERRSFSLLNPLCGCFGGISKTNLPCMWAS